MASPMVIYVAFCVSDSLDNISSSVITMNDHRKECFGFEITVVKGESISVI